ncbi:hypothetical protein [Herbiconiux daphne]|uniref:DUF4232 domain-containing protein n=1 Tax=Herbiconiux daphne TaxID=2970914 RepID=A0ABT2H2M1_9MICO|nr:hypothetical protein [Herbiconiux daphne]MCS5734196.1 hypothetical protein [Herbiconiux daphne]
MRRTKRRRSRATGLAALIALALVAVVAGCSSSPAAPMATSGAPSTPRATPEPPVVVDGVGLAILQNRPDYGKRVLELSVTNEGDEPITVTGARFESAQFVAAAEWAKSTEVPPGLTRYLPVQLPDPVCPAPDAPATLTITITAPDGSRRDVTAAPTDAFGVLPRIAGEDCLADAVAAIATVRLDDDLEVSGTGTDSVAHLKLVVEPAASAAAAEASGTLRLSDARFTILMAPTDGDVWPLDAEFSPGDPARDFVLDVTPARCDPHAVAEDKRGTFLPVEVSIADGPSGTVDIPSSDALRLALYDFIAAHCGYAPQ